MGHRLDVCSNGEQVCREILLLFFWSEFPLWEDIHHLIILLMMFMRMGMEPLMFKRDIRKAYRTIPISVNSFDFAHVCFAFEGHYWACRQLGMPFGCVAAVLSIIV